MKFEKVKVQLLWCGIEVTVKLVKLARISKSINFILSILCEITTAQPI